jgi:hypothetical protein
VVENPGPRPADVRLAAQNDRDVVEVSVPQGTVVAAGGSSRVVVRASAARRRWWGGTRQLPFTVQALSAAGGGPPLATAAAAFADEPDRRMRMIAIVTGAALGIVGLVVVLGVAGVFGGGGSSAADDDASPTPSPDESETSTETGTPTASATGAAPAESITAGEWTYNFVVTANTCEGEPAVGAEYTFAYIYSESPQEDDGYLSPGEPVEVHQVGGSFLGTYSFAWPNFGFTYAIDGGEALLVNTFDNADHGTATLTETYTTDTGTCAIDLADSG